MKTTSNIKNIAFVGIFVLCSMLSGCFSMMNKEEIAYFPGTDIVSATGYLDRNGAMHGPSTMFYRSGKLKKKSNFLHGEIDGIFEGYYENGKLLVKCEYDNGGLQNILEYWAPDSSALPTGGFVDGNGKVLRYDSRGLLVESGKLRDGYIEGFYYLHARNEVVDSILHDPKGQVGIRATVSW